MKRRCCSSVPNWAIVGATSRVVTLKVSWLGGTSNCASSSRNASRCSAVRPAPPCSSGHRMAPKPASNFVRCHAMRRSSRSRSSASVRSWKTDTSSEPVPHADDAGGRGDACSFNQRLARARNSSTDSIVATMYSS